jgi:hypothetical protein
MLGINNAAMQGLVYSSRRPVTLFKEYERLNQAYML